MLRKAGLNKDPGRGRARQPSGIMNGEDQEYHVMGLIIKEGCTTLLGRDDMHAEEYMITQL